jgi:ribonuclease D
MSNAEAPIETPAEVAPLLPLLSRPRNPEVVYVDDQDELFAAVARLAAAAGPFAVDAERASGFKYSQRAYLVQVTRPGAPIYLIDPIPLAGTDAMAAFAELLATDEWILHAATQDLPCLAELGLRPSALFDTELGSRLAAFERVGLGAVVERFLEVRLAKEHSAADWSIRPLNADWLNYAALDVDVLQELRDGLYEHLKEQGKLEIAQEEFAHLLAFKPKPAKTDRWRGVSGIHTIRDQRTLAIIRELWTRREQVAERVDVSPGRLIPDSSIVAAAKANPRSRSELAGLKDFNGRGSRTFIDEWWSAIQAGAASRDLPAARAESTGIPHHKSWSTRFPEADARLKAVRAAIEEIAKQMNLPVENLVSPDPIRQLCFEPAGTDLESVQVQLAGLGVRSWQRDAISHEVSRALVAARPTS